MPYIFDSDNVYGPKTAVVKGDLTDTDVRELQDIQPVAMAMNGAYGWSGTGLDLVGKITSLRQLDVLPYTRTDISILCKASSLVGLFVGTNCRGTLDFSDLRSLRVLRFYDSARGLRFTGVRDLGSLVEIHGNPSTEMLRVFEDVKSLKALSVLRPSFVDLHWLSSFDLHALKIERASKLVGLDGLATQKNLAYLKFGGNKNFFKLNELCRCSNLRYLMLDECGTIDSLAPILSLEQLELLSLLGDTTIKDGRISVLDCLTSLKQLRFCDRKHYDRKNVSNAFDMNVFYAVGGQYFSS